MFTGILDFLQLMTTPCFVLNADGEMLGCSHSFNADPVLVMHQHLLVSKAAAQLSYQDSAFIQLTLLQQKYLLSILQLDNEQCRCWLVSCQQCPDRLATLAIQPVAEIANPILTQHPVKTALVMADLVLESELAEFRQSVSFSAQLQLLMQQHQLYDLEQQLTHARQNRQTLELLIGTQTYTFVPQHLADSECLFIQQKQHCLHDSDFSALLQALETLTGGIVVMDATGNMRYLSRQIALNFPHFTGKPQQPALEQLVCAVLHHNCKTKPEQLQAILRWLRRQFRQQKRMQFQLKLSDGRTFQYRDYVQPHGSRVGVLTDDTSASMLEQLLQLAASQSEHDRHRQFNLLSTLSHEIRTPLNAMTGLVELLMTDPVLSQHQYISTIDKTSRHLLQLLNDVLDLSKLGSEQTSLQLAETDLRQLCEDVMESFVAKARLKGLRLELFIDPAINGQYLCDSLRLRQVLQNLLSNSLKFTLGPHGKVRLDVLAKAEQQRQQQQITFHIIDNGIGISPDQQKRIFDSFSQATPDIYYRFGGTGLGLSISTYICRLMDCKLVVDSQLGQGADFHFSPEFQRLSISPWQWPENLLDHPVYCNSQSLQQLLARYQEQLPFRVLFRNATQMLQSGQTSEQVRILDLHDNTIRDKAAFLAQYSSLTGLNFVINSSLARQYQRSDLLLLNTNPFRLSQWLQMLLQKNATPALPQSAVLSPQAHRAIRLLIVDDNPENLYVLQQQLAALGYCADQATDAETAYNLYQLQPYQLLLTDYQLSGWNGAELAFHLRNYEQQYQLPASQIWILTGNNTSSCQAECESAGVNQLLLKPCSLAVLQQKLTDFVKTIRQPAGLPTTAAVTAEIQPLADTTAVLVDPETIFIFTGPLQGEALKHTLAQFRIHLEQQQQKLQLALQQHNRLLQLEIFHNIKSNAQYYGSMLLSQMAEQLETQLLDPARPALQQTDVRSFEQQLRLVVNKFTQLEQANET